MRLFGPAGAPEGILVTLPSDPDQPAILVLCSCPDEAVAIDIARILVTEGLAACVNRIPGVQSIYQWQERICEGAEQLLMIKTVPARYEALEMRLKALHPYEIPEIIVIPIVTGSSQYLAWLAAAAKAPTTDSTY
jgi:periplasmic divalent cation tolerance protein